MSTTITQVQLTEVSGTIAYGTKCLPIFLVARDVAEKLKGRGIVVSEDRIKELAEAGRLPCFYFDGDRSAPLFIWADLQEWLKDQFFWRQDALTMLKVEVVHQVSEQGELAQKVPSSLTHFESLYEYTPGEAPVVYFLCANGKVVYVGQTTNLRARTKAHVMDGKEFDRVLFMPVPRSDVDQVEQKLISTMKPKYNLAHAGRAEGVFSLEEKAELAELNAESVT